MEKHKCKLCLRSFSNGRALGGHMRSHMLNLPIPPKQDQPPGGPTPIAGAGDDHDDDHEPASSSEGAAGDQLGDEEELEKGLPGYVLRENPKKSVRLADPEFSFTLDAASVVLQDRESETESSKNPTRRRSKRNRKLPPPPPFLDHHHHQKKIKLDQLSKTESWPEPEPVSSISDATTEEDVAFCLMMLSRDRWIDEDEEENQLEHGRRRRRRQGGHDYDDEEEEEEEEEDGDDDDDDGEESERFVVDETDESDELKQLKDRGRGKYKCETCKKVFRSYQALGGHRASHKKIKAACAAPIQQVDFIGPQKTAPCLADVKIHECPVCFRKFASGQALGGHKRSHISGSASASASAAAAASPAAPPLPPRKASSKVGDSMIDLNLPAPLEDDDISQIEHSAVSDAEFVNPIIRR